MRFKDNYYFLSNMYPCIVVLEMYGEQLSFPSAESAYQACKCRELKWAIGFQHLNGYDAKKHGKKVPLRFDWESVKLQCMKNVVEAKFTQNPKLLQLLHSVDSDIIEENTWGDMFWGVYKGVGENHLGKILTEVKNEL